MQSSSDQEPHVGHTLAPAGLADLGLQDLSLAEVIPPRILPKVLGRWDLLVVYVSIIYASYASGQMANAGWSAIGIWILAYVVFLIPTGMCSLEMGTLFPEEGGVYVWASKTMGKFAGFMGGWLAWMPVFGSLATWTAIISAFLSTAFLWQLDLWQQLTLQVGLVWVAVILSLLSLRYAQTIVNGMFVIYAGLSVLCFAVGAIYFLGHNSVSSTPLPTDWHEFLPNLSENGYQFGLAILLLLGVDLPFSMGIEMRSARQSSPWMIFGGTLLLGIFYLMTTTAILLTTPAGSADPFVALALMYRDAGFAAWVPWVAFFYAITNLAQNVCYQYAFARLLFIAGIERHLPRIFSQLDPRTRTPTAAILLQGAIITVMVLVIYSSADMVNATQVILAALVVIWCLSNFFFIVPALIARYRYAQRYVELKGQVWQIPGGLFGAWVVNLIAVGSNCLAIYYCFAAPWVQMPVLSWAVQVGLVCGIAIGLGLLIYGLNVRQSSRINMEEEMARYATLNLNPENLNPKDLTQSSQEQSGIHQDPSA